MKKLGLFLGLFLMAGIAKAEWFGSDQYTINYSTALAASISTNTVVVSLSNTTGYWPHPIGHKAIVIDSISADIDKAATTTSTLKLGVVEEINPSTGTVSWFWKRGNALNVSNTDVYINQMYSADGLNCKVNLVTTASGVSSATTPYLLTSDVTTGSAVYQSDLGLPSVVTPVNGTYSSPQTGDIVLNIVNGAAAVNLNLIVKYHVIR